jgi:apolipoprotein N-acyltransferase
MPLLYSLKRERPFRNFVSGFVAGMVTYLGLLYWVVVAMNKYGGLNIYLSLLALLLLACYLALYTGIFTLSVSFFREKAGIPFYVSAPLVWVLLEYLRGIVITGFPWSYLAHSQHRFLGLIQIVSVTGTYFISFLIVAVNAILLRIAEDFGRYSFGNPPRGGYREGSGKAKKDRLFIGYTSLVVVLLVLSLAYGTAILRSENPGREGPTAAIVQGNITQDVKWDEASRLNTVRTYVKKTVEETRGVDLVIWPETAIPFLLDQEIHLDGAMRRLPVLLGASLLFGTVSRDAVGRFYNSARILDRTGRTAGMYHKVHLVPFGEYTPLRQYLPFLEKMSISGGEFFPGDSHKPISTDLGGIGLLICYEGLFPAITSRTVRAGAQVLVNLTNDAWYDHTSAPYQHLMFYVFRAIETDRYVLRAANTGISAIIDPRGHILAKTTIFKETVLKGSFQMRTGTTFYVRHGDYFVLLVLATLIGALILSFHRKKKLKTQTQPSQN